MTELIIFCSTFILVFALGFQSMNVNNGHFFAAGVTSFAISLSNMVLFKTIPQADVLQVISYLLAGPLAITASMWAHRKYMPAKRLNELSEAVSKGMISINEAREILRKDRETSDKSIEPTAMDETDRLILVTRNVLDQEQRKQIQQAYDAALKSGRNVFIFDGFESAVVVRKTANQVAK